MLVPLQSLTCKYFCYPVMVVTKFSGNFVVGVPLGYMAPTTTFRTFIPSYLVVGSWMRVSTNVVFDGRSLTKTQEDNGPSLVILWSPCRFRSGKVVYPRGILSAEPNVARPRGQNFTLQPTDYMIGPASGNPNICLTWPRASQPTSDGVEWQLGTSLTAPVGT